MRENIRQVLAIGETVAGEFKRYGNGITPGNLEPDPKNPIVAALFRTIGFADELGSGVRKIFKYARSFAGSDPSLQEGDVFRASVSLDAEWFAEGVLIKEGKNRDETINVPIYETIYETINETIKHHPGFSLLELSKVTGKSRATVARAVSVLKKQGLIEYRGSKKTGGYYPLPPLPGETSP